MLFSSTGAYFASVAVACGVALLWLQNRRSTRILRAARAETVAVHETLQTALGTIRQFAVSRGLFVSNLAEEIQGPLAAALVHADLLRSSAREPAIVERYARSVAENLRHLCSLVDSFLRLARLPSEGGETAHVPVHVHDVVLEAVRRCHWLAETRGVQVVVTLAETGNYAAVEVLGDLALLETMIENLVRNAVLATARASQVSLSVSVLGGEVILAVRDHAAGVVEGAMDAEFDEFFAAHGPAITKSSMLSLAIAKRVAEHHHGAISRRVVPEGGCEHEVRLPRWSPEATMA